MKKLRPSSRWLLMAMAPTMPGCIAHAYQEYVQDVQVRVVHKSGGSPVPGCRIETVGRHFVERGMSDAGGNSVLPIGSSSYINCFQRSYSHPDMVTDRRFVVLVGGTNVSEEIGGVFRTGARLEGESLALEIQSIDRARVTKSLKRRK